MQPVTKELITQAFGKSNAITFEQVIDFTEQHNIGFVIREILIDRTHTLQATMTVRLAPTVPPVELSISDTSLRLTTSHTRAEVLHILLTYQKTFTTILNQFYGTES